MTCSRPQRNVHWPGFEPGTPWSENRHPNHCATPCARKREREGERERETLSRPVESSTSSIDISKQVFWTGGVISNLWNSDFFQVSTENVSCQVTPHNTASLCCSEKKHVHGLPDFPRSDYLYKNFNVK